PPASKSGDNPKPLGPFTDRRIEQIQRDSDLALTDRESRTVPGRGSTVARDKPVNQDGPNRTPPPGPGSQGEHVGLVASTVTNRSSTNPSPAQAPPATVTENGPTVISVGRTAGGTGSSTATSRSGTTASSSPASPTRDGAPGNDEAMVAASGGSHGSGGGKVAGTAPDSAGTNLGGLASGSADSGPAHVGQKRGTNIGRDPPGKGRTTEGYEGRDVGTRDGLDDSVELTHDDTRALTSKDTCTCETEMRLDADDASKVDLDQVPASRPEDRDSAAVERRFQHKYGVEFKDMSKAELDELMASDDIPIGTKIALRGWKDGAKNSHMIMAEKTPAGMRYYDGDKVLTEAPANTKRAMVLKPGKGRDRGASESAAPMPVYIWREPGMPKTEFNDKAEDLARLSAEGKTFKAPNPVPRDRSVPEGYRQDLINRIWRQYSERNREFADRLVERVTKRMEADHVHELQLGGPDTRSNLRMLDGFTNRQIGMRQIRPQIAKLPDGTPIRIKVRGSNDGQAVGTQRSTPAGPEGAVEQSLADRINEKLLQRGGAEDIARLAKDLGGDTSPAKIRRLASKIRRLAKTDSRFNIEGPRVVGGVEESPGLLRLWQANDRE
ncbi:hypothetical protein, partial [Pseudonocardia acaciae]|uniref:hypothetical protein n=1 Tax=Pseudonocardia acaciae TaxID=551276 RepID=UPI000683F551